MRKIYIFMGIVVLLPALGYAQVSSIPGGGSGTGSGTVAGTTGAIAAFTGSTTVGDATAGIGISIAGGAISTDSAIIPQWSKGAGAPSADCTEGRDFYTDTTADVLYFCKATDTWQALGTGGGTVLQQYGGSFTNSGAAIAATVYSLPQRVPAACTIGAWSIGIPKADTGTATVKFVRVAAGTASPGSGNEINTSGVSLSSGTFVYSTTVTDFTDTTLDAGDIVAVALTTVGGSPTGLTAKIYCQE